MKTLYEIVKMYADREELFDMTANELCMAVYEYRIVLSKEDAEVILNDYREWGINNMVRPLRGEL